MSGQWLPIETAPKDGTEVLILMDLKAIQASFIHGPYKYKSGWTPVSLPSHGCGCCSSADPPPTHWMPLPPPPVQAALR